MAEILPFPRQTSFFTGDAETIMDCAERLLREIRHLDRLCRLGSGTGAFRPNEIRCYREHFDIGALSLPGSGRGLTGSELVAHLELVLESIADAMPSGFPLPHRLDRAMRRSPAACLSTLNRMVGFMSASPAGYPLEFDAEEYSLMREYAPTPSQKLGTLVSYALRLAEETLARIHGKIATRA